ncbi:MAG TPA: Ser-Thr-rich GPI-anchored membrane family protein [Blastocatellia bacterium]|nr:Ser-Thr-rich GPI-anchored membrane family protein [Blastocatellia bacterium]
MPDPAGQVVAPPTFALNSSFDPSYNPASPRGTPFPFSDELILTTTGGIVRFSITSLATTADSAQNLASTQAEPEFLPFPSGTGFPLAAAIDSTVPGGKTMTLIPVSNGLVAISDNTVTFTPVPEGAGSVLGPPSLLPSGAILLPVSNGIVRVEQETSQFLLLPQESGSVISLPLDISPSPSSPEILLATTNGYAIVRPSGVQFLPLPTGSGENISSSVGLTRAIAANQPPRAEAGSDRTVEAGVETIFDASTSEDPDGTIVSYFWDFGDGTTATGRTVAHSFTTVGVFTVTLTVRDDDGATATDQLRVTVVDTTAPTVKVLSPTGGDIVPSGGTLTIRWSSFDTVGVVRHDILLAVDGVNFTTSIATNLPGFLQSFDWSVPGTLLTNTARIRVIARDGSGNTGQGDSPLFIIRDAQPPSVTILSPVGGETVPTGGSLLIRWISSDNVGVASHTVLLAPDGVQFTTVLASALPGTTQEFLWLVPASLVASSARIRVVARDAAGNEAAGESGVFTIQDTIAPTVIITSPMKGQTVNAGGTLTIRWQSTDNVGVVAQDILFSADGGASYPTTIASGLSGKQTSFFWTIPANLVTSSARIRILARDAAGNVGEEDSGTFSIRDATPPTVFVTRPRTNEIVNPGTSFTITWDSSDNVGVISHDILLSLNAGRNYSITIISGLSGDVRSFDWTVPGNIETNQARIRVVAYDAFGNAGFDDTGNFTIRDTLPPTVSILAPRTGQTVNPGTVFTIRWASSDNVRVLSHDIDFSTNGGQSYTSLATGISGTDQEYVWNVPLVTTTQARLRITARDAAGLVGVAETGNFTIRDALGPSVTVLQPRVGQSVSPGTTLTIQWTSSDNLGVASHEIRFSSNGCVSFPTTIATGLPGSQQSYLWDIPADINTTRACIRVIARDAAGNIGQDDSGLFTIRDSVAPSVTLLYPTGGETFAGGSQVTVRWSSSDNITVASHDLYFSSNGGATFSPIATGLSGSQQSFSWTVPNNLATSRAQIRVIARDAAGNAGQATSGNFTITDVTPPQVSVTRPGAGDIVQAGRSTTIRWTSSDNIGVVAHDIQLSTNGGASFAITVAANLPGTQQTFTWNVPAEVVTNQAVIRVIARDAAGNSGQGDSGIFVIQPAPTPPTVRLLAPNGGEVIQAGSVFTVRWTSSDDRGIASHDLLLSTDGGQSFPFTIQTGLPGSAQSFAWSVPSTLATTQARLRVIARDVDGLTAQDDSDADFTIERPPAPPGDKLLVASDDVTIVAGLPSQPTVFATIPTRGNSRRVAVAPNGEFALAVNSDNTVSFISDLSNNPRETRLITVGQGPSAIAISSDATFAITVNGENLPLTLSLIRDLTTTPSVRTVQLGNAPSFAGAQDVVLSRSGDLAFIPIAAGVLIIEGLRSRPFPTFRTIIPIVQGTPTSIALSPDEATAYVTTTNPDQIVVIRGISGVRPSIAARVTTGLGRGPRAVRLTPDGRRLLVTNSGSNDLSFYRVEGEDLTFVTRLSVGSRPTAIALSPDGSFAIVANSGDRTLSLIENTSGTTPTVNPQPIGPAPELATDRNAVQSLAFLPR